MALLLILNPFDLPFYLIHHIIEIPLVFAGGWAWAKIQRKGWP